MRFLVDACVDISVDRWLRAQGHESSHLRDEHLQRLPNGDIFTKAAAEGRVIVTLDLDFGEIVSFSHGNLVSVITFRVHNTRGAFLIGRLDAVLPKVTSFLEHGVIVIIEEARYRIRQLPITR
jgi:predicted nuclease of predicted toxin-antitoxin system